jgi:hypothetical protein
VCRSRSRSRWRRRMRHGGSRHGHRSGNGRRCRRRDMRHRGRRSRRRSRDMRNRARRNRNRRRRMLDRSPAERRSERRTNRVCARRRRRFGSGLRWLLMGHRSGGRFHRSLFSVTRGIHQRDRLSALFSRLCSV